MHICTCQSCKTIVTHQPDFYGHHGIKILTSSFFCFCKSTSIHIFMCVRVCVCARLCEIASEQMCNLVCLLTFMYMCERVHVCVIKLHGSAA